MKNTAPTTAFLEQFEAWLNSFLNFEKLPQKNLFWLDTMEQFSALLLNPQNEYKTFHVAGSKGKGSTSAFISSILEEAGLKTGLYTSPHILSFLERITQNQEFFPKELYEASAEELMKTVKSAQAQGILKDRPITWFELVTLYSFLCFKKAGVDAAVFEVGLGGRLDATNVIKPKACCIGPIELEHTEFLGDTLEKIAAEKGGIIKENTPVFIAPQTKEVKEVFKKIAAQKKAPLHFSDECCSIKTRIQNTAQGTFPNLTMETEITSSFFRRPIKTSLKLLGDFQAQNAALASLAVKSAFPEITEEEIERGLSKTTLPARFELLPPPESFENIPFLILDGAHTPKSTAFTLETIKKAGIEVPSLLFACAQDKHSDEMAHLFAEAGTFKSIFLTVPGGTKKSDIKAVEKAFEQAGLTFDSDEDYSRQIKKALAAADKDRTPLLVTGSFYLAAEVKKIISCV